MNRLLKLNDYPDVDGFRVALDSLDLVSRCRVMQHLQSVVYPFKEGYRLNYACMDGVLSPLVVIAGKIRRRDVAPYSLACNLLSRTVGELAAYPFSTDAFDLPVGFSKEGNVVRHAGDLRSHSDLTRSAHEVSAYILLNKNSHVEIGEESRSCINKTVFKRHLTGVSINTDAGGLHDNVTSITLSGMADYIKLFNGIRMALNGI